MRRDKIVFFDIDGTLVNSYDGDYTIPVNTRRAIEDLKEQAYVICATGRSKALIPDDIMSLNFDGFITANGAHTELFGEVLFNHYLDSMRLLKTLFFFEDNDVTFMFEEHDVVWFSDKDKYTAQRLAEAYNAPLHKFRAFEKEHLPKMHVNKYVIIDKHQNIKKYDDIIHEDLAIHYYHLVESLGVSFKNVNKALGCKAILKDLGLTVDQAYCFGDGGNDIEMFELIPNNVAMIDGSQKLIDIAKYKADPIEQDGIYKALQMLNLLKI